MTLSKGKFGVAQGRAASLLVGYVARPCCGMVLKGLRFLATL